MIHINDDKLLKYALETLADAQEKSKLEDHLVSCQECQARFEEIHRDLGIIAGLRPARTSESSWMHRWIRSLIRIAALLVVGIVLGIGASPLLTNKTQGVSPCYVILSSPADSISQYAVPDATEISADYDY